MPTKSVTIVSEKTDQQQNRTILQRAMQVSYQTEPSQIKALLAALIEQAFQGTLSWNKNLVYSIELAIKAIDQIISKQLATIMHHEKLAKLEGSWRGLHYLIVNTETNANLKLKVLNIAKHTLYQDLNRAAEFDQSQLFKKIYESEFGTPGGEPYAALLGDYDFSHHPNDIDALMKISQVAAAAFCPFIAAASPSLFGFSDWSALAKPRDLAKIFDAIEYSKWRSLRETDDARFIVLTLPRVLARLPYGRATNPIMEFDYEEATLTDTTSTTKLVQHDYCWMNATYTLGQRLTNAFAKYGWCTSIRGAEGGGKVANLPLHVFTSDDGDQAVACPTEIGITDRREAELSRLGFLPLCHYKNSDYSAFFGAQTIQRPAKYDRPAANANAEISARLPYVMATSRFAHYLKVMARDKIGYFMRPEEIEIWLNRWILNYVNGNAEATAAMKAQYPLAAARIEVQAIPGKPGAYHAIAWLQPWLQMEELTASIRLVATIPQLS